EDGIRDKLVTGVQTCALPIWFYNAIHNQSGSEAGSQPQEEHLTAFIAPDRLHGGVIYQLCGEPECLPEIKSEPTPSQIFRLGHRSEERRVGKECRSRRWRDR